MVAKGRKPEAAEAVPTHLSVRALRPGFRRAGRAWPAEVTTVALADLSAAQIEALLAEPLLETGLVPA